MSIVASIIWQVPLAVPRPFASVLAAEFLGLRVHTRSGQVGTITASFGKGGKFKAHFPTPGIVDHRFVEGSSDGVAAAAAAVGAGAPAAIRPGDPIFLRYRKRQYDPHKDKRRMTQ